MQTGKLRRRVTLLAPQPGAPNQYGEATPNMEAQITVWADIQPIKGHELEFARSFAENVTTKIMTRYLPGADGETCLVAANWQAQYGTRNFAINAVLNRDERNREMILLCTEIS